MAELCKQCEDRPRVPKQVFCRPCKKAWYKVAHPEKYAAQTKRERQRRREKYSEKRRQQLQARNRARRAQSQLSRMPADNAARKTLYANRPDGYEIDHIVPYRGLTDEGYKVWGLDVSWNIHYLTPAQNLEKGRRVVPGTELAPYKEDRNA